MVLHAGELSGGAGGFFSRLFLKSGRAFTIEFREPSGQLALTMRRPFTFLFSRATISDETGTLVGTIRQRWAWFARAFDVEDDSGRVLASLHGPFFRPWTFRVMLGARQIGAIKKMWSGIGKEMFSTADNFEIELAAGTSPQLRPLCLAATLLIDFVYFERSG